MCLQGFSTCAAFKRTLVVVLIVVFAAISHARADDLHFEIKAYGATRAAVVLPKSSHRDLTTQLSMDGKTLRLSGVGVSFINDSKSSGAGLVAYQQQVTRGSYTDLVIGLTQAVEIDVVPGNTDLTIFLRRKEQPDSRGLIASAPLKTLGTSKADRSSAAPNITLVFPAADGAASLTTLSHQLRAGAYWIDFCWAWLTGQSVPPSEGGKSCVPAADSDHAKSVEQLQGLVDDLTREIVELRKRLPADRP